MTLTELAGYAGAALAGGAYVPQIKHLLRERCVAGVSRAAFTVWFAASALILYRALAIGEPVFIALGAIQTIATAFISVYVARHEGSYCEGHAPPDSTSTSTAIVPDWREAAITRGATERPTRPWHPW